MRFFAWGMRFLIIIWEGGASRCVCVHRSLSLYLPPYLSIYRDSEGGEGSGTADGFFE